MTLFRTRKNKDSRKNIKIFCGTGVVNRALTKKNPIRLSYKKIRILHRRHRAQIQKSPHQKSNFSEKWTEQNFLVSSVNV